MYRFRGAATFVLLFSLSGLCTTLSFTNKEVGSCLDLEDHTGQSIADQTPTIWHIPLNNASKVTIGVPVHYRAVSHRISTQLTADNLELEFIWWGSPWTLCVDLETEPTRKLKKRSHQCELMKSHAGWPKQYALQHPNQYHWSHMNVTNSLVDISSDLSQIELSTNTSWYGPANMAFDLMLAWWGYPFTLCTDFERPPVT